jgi:hypothetical protein
VADFICFVGLFGAGTIKMLYELNETFAHELLTNGEDIWVLVLETCCFLLNQGIYSKSQQVEVPYRS